MMVEPNKAASTLTARVKRYDVSLVWVGVIVLSIASWVGIIMLARHLQ